MPRLFLIFVGFIQRDEVIVAHLVHWRSARDMGACIVNVLLHVWQAEEDRLGVQSSAAAGLEEGMHAVLASQHFALASLEVRRFHSSESGPIGRLLLTLSKF